MCYAIPGKVTEINGNLVTVDYFGEKRKARNEFYQLSFGDYVYAQGGLVIQKLSEESALETLDVWQDFFAELKDLDLRLAQRPRNLYQIANATRQKHLGNACCVHGIIEFSNYCENNCLYCGIRKGNAGLQRYRMGIDEIIQACKFSVKELNFKALVLQSGLDPAYSTDDLAGIIDEVMKDAPALLILSIGERDIEVYRRLYGRGARGALLRFETSNPALYEKFRPGHKPSGRIELIKELKAMGYMIFTGFLIGLPGSTEEDILNDIKLMGELDTDMFSFGPFIPHPDTPLGNNPRPSLDSVLTAIARTRIMYPQAKILATTALATLDKENGIRQGLLSGANSLMINLTPQKYLRLYDIYPDRACIDTDMCEEINSAVGLLKSIGRAPTDLGI